jgi:hypothetical protein
MLASSSLSSKMRPIFVSNPSRFSKGELKTPDHFDQMTAAPTTLKNTAMLGLMSLESYR